MTERKEIRRRARHILKAHYWAFVAACLMAAVLGTEYTNSLQLLRLQRRVVLHGPWLPIYGGGMLLILIVLYRFRKSAFTQFWLIVVLCGIVEYLTSWLLEILHDGQRWWDYTGYYLNLNGRICAEGLLVFGIGGMAVVYIAAPLIDDLLIQVKQRILWPICGVLLVVFAADAVYSTFVPNTGKGVTKSKTAEEAANQERLDVLDAARTVRINGCDCQMKRR